MDERKPKVPTARRCGLCGRTGSMACYSILEQAAKKHGLKVTGPYFHLNCARRVQTHDAKRSTVPT